MEVNMPSGKNNPPTSLLTAFSTFAALQALSAAAFWRNFGESCSVVKCPSSKDVKVIDPPSSSRPLESLCC